MTIESTKDKKFYDDSVADLSVPALEVHCAIVKKYLAVIEPKLNALGNGRALNVVELGAGSCVTSLLLSKRSNINKIVCLDISLKKMKEVFPSSVRVVGACSPEKISMIEGHFDAPLALPDHQFDIVIFDGALHHARSMWFVLEECRRVLRTDGILIAQREQYLGSLTASMKLTRLLQTPEVKAGVSENAYLRAQYEYYLRAAGFASVDFLPVAETPLQKMLGVLNGLVFSKWVIWANA